MTMQTTIPDPDGIEIHIYQAAGSGRLHVRINQQAELVDIRETLRQVLAELDAREAGRPARIAVEVGLGEPTQEPTPEQVAALDGLARHAIREHKAERTRDLREFAAEQNIDLDEEG